MASRRRLPLSFDPRQRGLKKLLGDLEAEIMEEVWKSEQMTVREVLERLSRKRDLAYTTVMTVMSRLADKGLLTRRRSDGAALLYAPAMSREEFMGMAIKRVLQGLITDLGTPTLSQFVDLVGGESEKKLDELARLIEQKQRKRT